MLELEATDTVHIHSFSCDMLNRARPCPLPQLQHDQIRSCERTRTQSCHRHAHSLSCNMLEHEGATVIELEADDAMSTHLTATCSNTKVRPCSNSKLPTPCPLIQLQHALPREAMPTPVTATGDLLEHEGALELEAADAIRTHSAAACLNTKIRPCSNSKILPTPRPLT